MVILEIIQAPPYIILIGLSFKILALIRTYVNLLFIVIKRFSVMQLLARVIVIFWCFHHQIKTLSECNGFVPYRHRYLYGVRFQQSQFFFSSQNTCY